MRTAIVTGAAAGIGQGIALALASKGYLVYANARSEEKLKETLELGKSYKIKPLIFDVRDIKAVVAAIESLEKIDCLVNNAGLSMKGTPIAEITDSDWNSIMETNARGYFFVMQSAIKKMKRGASIVNLSSGAAKTGGDFVSIPYAASKGAINSLTISMARALAPAGIRVNAVSPGFVDTAMLALNGMPKEYYQTVIPLGKLGQTTDITNMVEFLLSEKASFITGQIIEVNGGDIMG